VEEQGAGVTEASLTRGHGNDREPRPAMSDVGCHQGSLALSQTPRDVQHRASCGGTVDTQWVSLAAISPSYWTLSWSWEASHG
jgi:hypothetical protein